MSFSKFYQFSPVLIMLCLISMFELISDYKNFHFVYCWSIESSHVFSTRVLSAWITILYRSDGIISIAVLNKRTKLFFSWKSCYTWETTDFSMSVWIRNMHSIHHCHHQWNKFVGIYADYVAAEAESRLYNEFALSLWKLAWIASSRFSRRTMSFGGAVLSDFK